MVIGVVMVNVKLGTERRTFDALREMPMVKDVYHVFGEADFVVVIDVGGLDALNKIVDAIRELEGVTETQTIVGAEL